MVAENSLIGWGTGASGRVHVRVGLSTPTHCVTPGLVRNVFGAKPAPLPRSSSPSGNGYRGVSGPTIGHITKPFYAIVKGYGKKYFVSAVVASFALNAARHHNVRCTLVE